MLDCVQSRLPEVCQICLQFVLIRPVPADVYILAVGAMAGHGRQRAEERMGNKNKNNTLKPWKSLSQNEKTQCGSPFLMKNQWFPLHLSTSATSDGTFRGSG